MVCDLLISGPLLPRGGQPARPRPASSLFAPFFVRFVPSPDPPGRSYCIAGGVLIFDLLLIIQYPRY